MRTAVRIALTGAMLATTALGLATTASAAPAQQKQEYSIPVGAITDLGALPKVSELGYDMLRLLGQ